MGQDGASVPRSVRVGPLGVLGLAAALAGGWALGRAPAVFDKAEVEAAAAAPVATAPAVQPAPTAPPPAAAPAPIIVTMPAAAAPQIMVVREGSGSRDPSGNEPSEVRWTLPLPTDYRPGQTPPPAPAVVPEVTQPEIANEQAAGFALATLAYADLGNGNHRGAAEKFSAALAADPKADNAAVWRKELKQLRKRWSGEFYAQLRDDGTPGLGTRPVLGGGQTGGQIAYTPNPLSRRPVYAVVRGTTTNSGGFGATSGAAPSSQVAAGVKWQVLPQVSVSGERLFAVEHGGRSAWTVRVAGGLAHRFGPVLADGYAEGGLVGFRHTDWFAGAQGRAAYPFSFWQLRVEPGVGVWAGVQGAAGTVSRFDLGPTLGVAWDRWNIRASADYRLKVAGNASPGSGPAVTVSGAF